MQRLRRRFTVAQHVEKHVEDQDSADGLHQGTLHQGGASTGQPGGGRAHDSAQVDLFIQPLANGRQQRVAIERREMDLWDQPLLYCFVVLLAGIEWYVRRRSNLL